MTRHSSRPFFGRDWAEAVYADKMPDRKSGRGFAPCLARQPDGIPKGTQLFRVITECEMGKRSALRQQRQFQRPDRQDESRPLFKDVLSQKCGFGTLGKRPRVKQNQCNDHKPITVSGAHVCASSLYVVHLTAGSSVLKL